MVIIIVSIIAGVLAGLGTGLIGMSAAVIISPFLVTFCEMEAYEAIGIALASDVLASLITAYTYGKNKNLDIKNGLIMMLSVLVFTLIGSYLSSLLPSIVLGGGTYIMTGFMGLKLIVRPTMATHSKMLDLNTKQKVVRSILSGIPIGFICGFIGAGGGVMLLIMLTVVLGYTLKTAVGTSTFIMAFTALTGSLSHFVILGRTPNLLVLCICIVTAIIGARGAAIFANKVSPKTLNRISGVTLLLIALILAIFNFI